MVKLLKKLYNEKRIPCAGGIVMKRILQLAAALTAACILAGCNPVGRVEHRTLRVTNYGHTKTRFASLQKAVDKYNAEHPKIQYSIEFNHYKIKFLSQFLLLQLFC